MSDKISDAVIDEMLAGLEGVTPGPYFQTGSPWFRDGTGVLAGSPDGNVAYLIADTDDGFNPRDEYEGFALGDKEKDAAHFARCSPETIRSLLLELRAYRTAANPLQAVLDGVAAAQKRIEELGLVGTPLIDSMSDEEFAADRSDENPNVGQAVVDSHHTSEESSARAYDRAAREMHGAFATLNFPDEVQS